MLEIILVAMAWSKGWRWRALIPVLISWTLIFTVSAALGEDAVGLVIFVAICEIMVLIAMNVKEPASAYKPRSTYVNPVNDAEQRNSIDEIDVTEENKAVNL